LTCHGQSSAYAVRESPGRGLGVFALHDMEPGTVLLRESPVLKIKPPSYVRGTGYPLAVVGHFVKAKFATLPWEQQEEVMGLTYYATPAEEKLGDKLGLIFRTNAYNSGTDIGLFPKIARINHSCRPNTSYYWNARLNKRVVFANRKIMKGEELFDSYISLLLTQDQRQGHLDKYGFKCGCEVCAAKRRARNQSDKRRVAIRKAFDDFKDMKPAVPQSKSARWEVARDAKASVQLAEMVHQEGLADYYANAYRVVAIAHARLQDWQNATIWANKGYELKVSEDPESPLAHELFHLTTSFVENWKNDLKGKGQWKEDV
jgi:hypothetical protein